jgi:hypothetical protein
MSQNQQELLHRIFAVNEQIVKQNYQIMMVLTQPTISKSATWVGLTNEEITDLYHNENLGQQSAVAQAIELLKERNAEKN